MTRAAISALKSAEVDLCGLLTCSSDFLGDTLELRNCANLQALVQPLGDMERFGNMMAAVITGTVTVLERQYKKYPAIDITELLAEETRSARSHNKLRK